MATFLYKTRGNSSPERKPRVFFTCHPDDFSKYFEKICEDILKTHDCAIFYTEDLNEVIEEKYKTNYKKSIGKAKIIQRKRNCFFQAKR